MGTGVNERVGSTPERRCFLDRLRVLLTTLVTPWQMLWGKLLSGLRVSSVLTSFLLWPVLLACLMPLGFWQHLLTILGYLAIVALCCVTTAMTALFCSSVFHRSAASLISTYLIIVVMFIGPLAAGFFAQTFYKGTAEAAVVEKLGVLSPFVATFSLPLAMESTEGGTEVAAGVSPNLWLFLGHVGWSLLYDGLLLVAMMKLFAVRWRVAD